RQHLAAGEREEQRPCLAQLIEDAADLVEAQLAVIFVIRQVAVRAGQIAAMGDFEHDLGGHALALEHLERRADDTHTRSTSPAASSSPTKRAMSAAACSSVTRKRFTTSARISPAEAPRSTPSHTTPPTV